MWAQEKLHLRRAFFVFAFATAFLSSELKCGAAPAPGAEMYYSMGQKYMEKGSFDMAALAFEKAVELSPDWPEAHNALGEAYVQLLRFEDAVAEFDKALELRNNYTQAKINRRRTIMSVQRYEPVSGSRLSRWHRFAILGGIVGAVTLISALVVHLSS